MTAPGKSSPDSPLPKKAYTGLPGRLCRYTGDAASALQIELSPGDVLAITATQVRQLFDDLGAFNCLLEDCPGMVERTSPLDWIKVVARDRRHRKTRRGLPTWRKDPYHWLVSTRLRAWLNNHSETLWGRSLSDEEAACLQGVLCGEGLLPLENDRPGEFPSASIATSLHALRGHRVIYEESRRFVGAELVALTMSDRDPDQVDLFLRNLNLPGFAQEFPPEFTAGGSLKATIMGVGMIYGYMGIWGLITSPRAVERLIAAAPRLNRKQLLEECRRLQFRRGQKVY